MQFFVNHLAVIVMNAVSWLNIRQLLDSLTNLSYSVRQR